MIKFDKNSLLTTTTLSVAFRISIVITIAAVLSYLHILGMLQETTKETLQKYITERGQKESALFSIAEDNHDFFIEQFLERWSDVQDLDQQERFSDVFITRESGAIGLSDEAYTGVRRLDGSMSKYMSAFVGRWA